MTGAPTRVRAAAALCVPALAILPPLPLSLSLRDLLVSLGWPEVRLDRRSGLLPDLHPDL